MALADDAVRIFRQLQEGILTGELVDLRSGDAMADDPARGGDWGVGRTVPAQTLLDLLTPPVDAGVVKRGLRLAGARITGLLDLEAAEVAFPILLKDCWFEQPINLAGANIRLLRLPGCGLPGLHAEQLTIPGDLELNNGFIARGPVDLIGARIGGNLVLDGAELVAPSGYALNADKLAVAQDMFCRGGFTAQGEVRLANAYIGGRLDLSGAKVSNPGGYALNADKLAVAQDMYCQDGFTAQGAVRLVGAHIGGQISFVGAKLTNSDGIALFADRLTVDQDMFCRDGFTAEGEVRLVGAQIGGQLDFRGAQLANPTGRTLDLEGLRAVALILRDLEGPLEDVDFTDAQVGSLVDDPASWPYRARLRGFVYDSLYEGTPVSARQRLDWLSRDPSGYSPQPYEQLSAVYSRAGLDQDARVVAIANEHRRRRTLPWGARVWSLLVDGLVGHGYRTAIWLVTWLVVGTLIYAAAYPADLTRATKPDDPAPPAFHPAIYALDVLLPIVDLEQQKHWTARGFAQWWTWASILAGWVLTTVLVTAFTDFLQERFGVGKEKGK
jgi:hypothetical protein